MVIVAAVDRTDRASAVLAEATRLGDQFDDSVHALHVMTRSEAVAAEEDSVSHDEGLGPDELRARATGTATAIAESNGYDTVEAVGRIGDPGEEIVRHADEHDAQYIVVSPQRKSQTGKLLFGSVAQSVLLNAPCPVVSLRADAEA